MAYSCANLLESHYFNGAVLIAGKDNLETDIRWPYVAELSPSIELLPEFVRPGDCIFVLGDILGKEPGSLNKLLRIAASLHASGIIFYRSKFLEDFSPEVIERADESHLPIILLAENAYPISDIICDISYQIASKSDRRLLYSYYGLMDMLLHPTDFELSSIQYIKHYSNFDFSKPHCGIYISSKPKDSSSIPDRKHTFEGISAVCDNILLHYYSNVLKSPALGAYAVLLPEKSVNVSIQYLASLIYEELVKADSSCSYRIGIGSFYEQIEDFYKSLYEAKQVVSAANTMNIEERVLSMDKMLTPLFLYSQKDNHYLTRIIEKNILPLIETDSNNKFQLHQTMRVFFASDKNMGLTASKLYIHRNTLTGRLSRIQELLGIDFDNTDQCFELGLALFAYKLFYMQDEE